MTWLHVLMVGWCGGTLGMQLVGIVVIVSCTFVLMDWLEVLLGHLVSVRVVVWDVWGA